jgi:hypothetical protein
MASPEGSGPVPRLVGTIVVAYTRESLPVSWLQVFRRFERTIERAGLDIRVRLHPIEDLPERYEVLVVPRELHAQAERIARGARLIATTREDALAAVTVLLGEIQAGTALRADPRRPDAPRVVVRRGYEEL